MDALDLVVGPARDLLGRVEAVLARAGAPADHAVWPLLRRLRALPTDAVDAVAALRPDPLAVDPADVDPADDDPTGVLGACADATAVLRAEVDWSGPAAAAHAARSAALAAGVDELARAARDTAAYAEAVADWADRTRREVAAALAAVLTSAQAVTVRTAAPSIPPPPEVPPAAADIAAHVLGAVDRAYDEADALRAAWADRLAERPEPAAVTPGPPGGGDTAVR